MTALRKDGVGSEGSSQNPYEFTEKLKRQDRATSISDGLEKCKTMVGDVLDGIGDPHRDQKLSCLLQKIGRSLLHLMVAVRQIDDRAVDYEDRLEKLEQQIQELEKRLFVDDGK